MVGGVLLLVLMVGTILFKPTPITPLGGITQGHEYSYTQYTGAIATTTEVKDGAGTFGGVVITEDFAGVLVFYDATSTTAWSKTNGTRIADFVTASTEGVYTFDVWLTKGLIMESADGFSFAGDITVLYR